MESPDFRERKDRPVSLHQLEKMLKLAQKEYPENEVHVENLESQEFGDSQETRDQWVTPDSLEIRAQWDPKDQWASLVTLFFKPDEKAR